MELYCDEILGKGGYRFLCPYVGPDGGSRCNSEWEYFLVRHVAMLSSDQQRGFESRICENYVTRSNGIQKCPGCNVFCMRQDTTNQCVRCIVCTRKKGKTFQFCWFCLREIQILKCENPQCDGSDPRIRYLKTCDMKEIYGVSCPSLRGCPECGILIQHDKYCKHMTCSKCNHGFCFVCLKPAKNGRYQCGSYRSPCPVAPPQTTLPGMPN